MSREGSLLNGAPAGLARLSEPGPGSKLGRLVRSYPLDNLAEICYALAPWGLGASFVEFQAGANRGTLRLSFDGAGEVPWRVQVALTPRSGTGSVTILPMSLNAEAQGSLEVSGFGTRWSKAVLMPTIVDRTDGEFTTCTGLGCSKGCYKES